MVVITFKCNNHFFKITIKSFNKIYFKYNNIPLTLSNKAKSVVKLILKTEPLWIMTAIQILHLKVTIWTVIIICLKKSLPLCLEHKLYSNL